MTTIATVFIRLINLQSGQKGNEPYVLSLINSSVWKQARRESTGVIIIANEFVFVKKQKNKDSS
jgi:hypothetical protein